MYIVKYLEMPYGEGFRLNKGSNFEDVLLWRISSSLWL